MLYTNEQIIIYLKLLTDSMGAQQCTAQFSHIIWIDSNISRQLQLSKPANKQRYKFISRLTIISTAQQAITYCQKLNSNSSQDIQTQRQRALVICSDKFMKNINEKFKILENVCQHFIIFCETKFIAEMYMNNFMGKQFKFVWEISAIDKCIQQIQIIYLKSTQSQKNERKQIIEKRKLIKKHKKLDNHLKDLKTKIKTKYSEQRTAASQSPINQSLQKVYKMQDQQANIQVSQFQTELIQNNEILMYFSEIIWINDNPNYIQQQRNLLNYYGDKFKIFNQCQQAVRYYQQHKGSKNLLILCSSSLVERVWQYIPQPIPYGSCASTLCLIFGQNDEKSKLVLQKYPQISFPCFWSIQDIVLRVDQLEASILNSMKTKGQKNSNSSHAINKYCKNSSPLKMLEKAVQADTLLSTPPRSIKQDQQKIFSIFWIVKNKEIKKNLPYHFLEKLFKQGLQIDIKDLQQFSAYLQQKMKEISELNDECRKNLAKNTTILVVINEVLDLKVIQFLCERIGKLKIIQLSQKQIKQDLISRSTNSIQKWLKNPIIQRIKNQFKEPSPTTKAHSYEQLQNKILMQLSK